MLLNKILTEHFFCCN